MGRGRRHPRTRPGQAETALHDRARHARPRPQHTRAQAGVRQVNYPPGLSGDPVAFAAWREAHSIQPAPDPVRDPLGYAAWLHAVSLLTARDQLEAARMAAAAAEANAKSQAFASYQLTLSDAARQETAAVKAAARTR